MPDHGLSDGLQFRRGELAGGCGAVQPADEPQGEADGVRLARRLPVLDVVGLAEPPVPGDQFGAGVGRVGGLRRGGFVASGEVFGDQPVVPLPALGRVELAQVMVTPADGDDGAIAGFVETVFGDRGAGHDAILKGESSTVLAFQGFQTAPPGTGG